MNNPIQLAILLYGVNAWNTWRASAGRTTRIDLRGAILNNAALAMADLSRADLRGAQLRRADLHRANLREADLRGANLQRANLRGADLRGTKLNDADLRDTDFGETRLSGEELRLANVVEAVFRGAQVNQLDIVAAARFVTDRLESEFYRQQEGRSIRRYADKLLKSFLYSFPEFENHQEIWRLFWARLEKEEIFKVSLSTRGIPKHYRFSADTMLSIGSSYIDHPSESRLLEQYLRATHNRMQDEISSHHAMQQHRVERLLQEVLHEVPNLHKVDESTRDTDSVIDRYPSVSMKNKVALGDPCTLRVAVTRQPVAKDREKEVFQLAVPPGAVETTVQVLVTAEDFEMLNDTRLLTVPVDRDSTPIIFEMIPQSTGEKKVKVEFFQNFRYVGGTTIKTIVVKPDELSFSRQVKRQVVMGLEMDPENRVPPSDLTILVTESKSDGDQMQYRFILISPANDLFFYEVKEPLRFTGSPSRWMEQLYKELGSLNSRLTTKAKRSAGKRAYRVPQAEPEDVAETLKTIGAHLYEQLFPQELKEIWEKRIRQRVSTIMIISNEPWIPWEIIKPSFEDENGEIVEDDFLCEGYILTRWLSGLSAPTSIKISRSALIAPAGFGLPNVQREAEFLKTFINAEDIEPSLIDVRQLLKSGGYQLIHFACHGSFDPEEHEQAIVYLKDGSRFRSREIAGERRNFGRDRPFVFINACQTARADFSLVSIGSWADKFINAKASGFLGSSWQVNDELAYQFSQAFYQALKAGQPVGAAMHQARLAIRDQPNPTWLAYTLYADPHAQVIFD